MSREADAILPYVFIDYADLADAFRPWDRRASDVAERVVGIIHSAAPAFAVEHIGSTAVPSCAGKGVIDLMLLSTPGDIAAARGALEELGFVRFAAPHAHPIERPVYLGAIAHDGERFRLHVHVLGTDAAEVATQRRFRDRLRSDPALVAEYVAIKRAVLDAGVGDSDAYNAGKHAFIRRVLERDPATRVRATGPAT